MEVHRTEVAGSGCVGTWFVGFQRGSVSDGADVCPCLGAWSFFVPESSARKEYAKYFWGLDYFRDKQEVGPCEANPLRKRVWESQPMLGSWWLLHLNGWRIGEDFPLVGLCQRPDGLRER